MYQQLIDAAAAHPLRADYDRLTGAGVPTDRVAYFVDAHDFPMLVLREGRTTWRVRNNPATLMALAERVAKCPGFTGKKTRRTPGRAEGVLYRHPSGFALSIPASLRLPGVSPLTVGGVVLEMSYIAKRLRGAIPDSWLVDLNAEAIEEELEPGWDLV